MPTHKILEPAQDGFDIIEKMMDYPYELAAIRRDENGFKLSDSVLVKAMEKACAAQMVGIPLKISVPAGLSADAMKEHSYFSSMHFIAHVFRNAARENFTKIENRFNLVKQRGFNPSEDARQAAYHGRVIYGFARAVSDVFSVKPVTGLRNVTPQTFAREYGSIVECKMARTIYKLQNRGSSDPL